MKQSMSDSPLNIQFLQVQELQEQQEAYQWPIENPYENVSSYNHLFSQQMNTSQYLFDHNARQIVYRDHPGRAPEPNSSSKCKWTYCIFIFNLIPLNKHTKKKGKKKILNSLKIKVKKNTNRWIQMAYSFLNSFNKFWKLSCNLSWCFSSGHGNNILCKPFGCFNDQNDKKI